MSKKICPKCNGTRVNCMRVVTPYTTMLVKWDCSRCEGKGFIFKRHLKRKWILK